MTYGRGQGRERERLHRPPRPTTIWCLSGDRPRPAVQRREVAIIPSADPDPAETFSSGTSFPHSLPSSYSTTAGHEQKPCDGKLTERSPYFNRVPTKTITSVFVEHRHNFCYLAPPLGLTCISPKQFRSKNDGTNVPDRFAERA
jgi:hypothetical protein